jgi:hypothetical protein
MNKIDWLSAAWGAIGGGVVTILVLWLLVARNERKLRRSRKPLPRQDIDAGWNR